MSDPFRDVLVRARALVGPSPTLLATLGHALSAIEPGFTPTRYGQKRLIDLLRSRPDLGQLRRRLDGHPEFVFRGPANPSVESAALSLRKSVWDAVTSFHPPPSGWRLDLASLKPVCDEARIAEEPERFLALPVAGTEFQQALLRAFVAAEIPAQQPEVDALLVQDDWFAALRGTLGDTWGAWVEHRRRAVVRTVTEWADNHGIPRDAVAQVARPPKRVHVDAQPTRAALHRLIDRLSPDEVERFPIPAWALRHLED